MSLRQKNLTTCQNLIVIIARLEYSKPMIRDLIEGLGGPKCVAELLASVRPGHSINENQISKWMERESVPWAWRVAVKNLATTHEYGLSDTQKEALDTTGGVID